MKSASILRHLLLFAACVSLAGCETIADGDPCDSSELNKYECASGETVFRCGWRDSERVWQRIDSCPSSQECVVRENARSYECRDAKIVPELKVDQ